MSHRLEEFRIIFEREKHRWDQTIVGDCVLLDPETNKPCGVFGVKVTYESEEMSPKCTYRVYGRWTQYENKYTRQIQRQIQAKTFVRDRPHDRPGVIAYLARAPEIGRKRASKLWDAFQSDSLRIATREPEVLASVTGLSEEKAERISKWLRLDEHVMHAKVELINLFVGHGMPTKLADKLIRKYGNRAADLIKRNPFRLLVEHGVGYKKADELYMSLGLDPYRLKRQALAAWYQVHNASEHTWFAGELAWRGVTGNIGSEADPRRALKLAKRAGLLSFRRTDSEGHLDDSGYNIWVATTQRANTEDAIARHVVSKFLQRPSSVNMADQAFADLSNHQRGQMLSMFTKGRISVLSGGPGTGKSFVAGRLANAIGKQFGHDSIAVVAPTGKASVRSTEALSEAGSPKRAQTVHRFLGISAGDETGFEFRHNEDNPSDVDFVFVDEAAMLSDSLLLAILQGTKRSCHIILVGDGNQLPPISNGAPFRDIIRSGLAGHAELTEVKRNAGDIVRGCHAMIAMRQPTPVRPADIELHAGRNWGHVQCAKGEHLQKIQLAIKAIVTLGFDPVWDTQIICPMNDRGSASRKQLNQMLQSELNENRPRYWPFAIRDKVINRKNTQYPVESISREAEPLENDGRVYVANGDQGVVLHEEPKYAVVQFFNPSRTVRIPKGCEDIELAYAITCHLAQGSEVPVGIVVIDQDARMLNSNNWLFTAVSRAKKLCLTVGPQRIMNEMIGKVVTGNRKTFLRELIDHYHTERGWLRDQREADAMKQTTDFSGINIQIPKDPKDVRKLLEDAIRRDKCLFCNRSLSHPESLQVGYGPTCAKKRNLPWGEGITLNAAVHAMEEMRDAIHTTNRDGTKADRQSESKQPAKQSERSVSNGPTHVGQ